jgi:hypothetical protein
MGIRLLSTIGATAVALALLPGTALAVAENEPNDGIHEADGGIVPGSVYDASVSEGDPQDWYVIHVAGPGDLDVTLNNLSDSTTNSVQLYLTDQDGRTLNNVTAGNAASRHIPYTAPGTGVYYAAVFGCCGKNNYQLSVSGPVVAGPRPPAAQATPNASPTFATAFGPLAGGTVFAGSIDAFDEQDFFYFYTAGPGAFDVALTNVDDASGNSPGMILYDRNRKQLSAAGNTDENTISHIRYTGARPAKYVLGVAQSGPVDEYQLAITPAELITAAVPARESAECAAALKARKKAKAKLDAAKAKLSSSFTSKAKRRWRRQVTLRKKAYAKAKTRATAACT